MEKTLTREEVAALRRELFDGTSMTVREQKAIMRYVEALESQFDAVNVALDDLGAQVTREVEAFQHRVATLEGREERTRENLSHLVDEARQERATAEARVRELEGRLSKAQDRIVELAAQEAEAETCEECGEMGGHSYLPVHGAEVPRMCSRATPPSPTPPPGLREAVDGWLSKGRAALRTLDGIAPKKTSDLRPRTMALQSMSAVLDGIRAELDIPIDAVRAAYDATGGEARLGPTPPAGDSDAFLAMLQTPAGDCALTVETESGHRYEVGGNWMHEVAEDATKYRAAVERIEKADGDAFFDAYAQAKGDLYVFSRWVLGLTLSTPPSGPGGGEGVDAEVRVRACGFKPESPQDEAAFAEVMQATARRIQSRARIAPTPTPEVPPLAPTTFQSALRGAFLVLDQCDAEERERWEKVLRMLDDSMRPVELPADLPPREWSTYEPPQMPRTAAPVVEWEADGVRVLGDGTLQCFAAGEWRPLPVHQVVGLASMAREESMAQRVTSPLNVKRDGDIVRVDLLYPRTPGNVREVEVHLSDTRASDGLRVSYDFDRDGWVVFQPITYSEFQGKEKGFDVYHDVRKWHEVVFIQAWSLEAEGADPLEPATRQDVIAQECRKTAESMRERIAIIVHDLQQQQEDGPTSDDNGHAFGLLGRLVETIRNTPTE